MKTLNVSQVRQQLSTLVDEVAQSGEEVLITRRGEPLAKLVSLQPKKEAERAAHPLRGLPIEIAEDFDALHIWY